MCFTAREDKDNGFEGKMTNLRPNGGDEEATEDAEVVSFKRELWEGDTDMWSTANCHEPTAQAGYSG